MGMNIDDGGKPDTSDMCLTKDQVATHTTVSSENSTSSSESDDDETIHIDNTLRVCDVVLGDYISCLVHSLKGPAQKFVVKTVN